MPENPPDMTMPETTDAAGWETRVAEILSDLTMSPSDKRLMLEQLRDAAGESGADEETYAPIEMQMRHALSLLADGGHDYAAVPSSDEGEELDSFRADETPSEKSSS